MKKIVKITSNNHFKSFKKVNDNFFVECYGVKLNVDDFHKITDEQKENNPKLKNWDFLFVNPKYDFTECIVLSANFLHMMYKCGNVQYDTTEE